MISCFKVWPKWQQHHKTSWVPVDDSIGSKSFSTRNRLQAACGWQRLYSHHSNKLKSLLAFRSKQDRFILKDVLESIKSHFMKDIWPRVSKSPFLRLPVDTIPNQNILVYKYLDTDFLSLVRKRAPLPARNQILKACLTGLAQLHELNITHFGIFMSRRATQPVLISFRHQA